MKDVRANVVTSLILVGTTLLSTSAWSMDEMTDGQLATTTGQDGLTVLIGLPSNTLNVNQVALFDGNGFATQTGAGALVLGQNANGLAAGSNPTQGNAMSLVTNSAISLVMDTSGGGALGVTTGSAPLLNVAIKLPTIMTLVTGDVGIAAATGTAGNYQVGVGTLGNANTGDILVMNSTSMTFNLAGTPLVTLQLGHPNQSAMIQLTSLNISSVVFNSALSLASPNGGVGASQLTTTPTLTGLNLSGATIDVLTTANFNALMNTSGTTGGVVLQCTSLSALGCSVASPATGVNFALTGLTAGTTGNSDTTFGGMKNAPMGTFGVSNMVVSGLKIGISGM